MWGFGAAWCLPTRTTPASSMRCCATGPSASRASSPPQARAERSECSRRNWEGKRASAHMRISCCGKDRRRCRGGGFVQPKMRDAAAVIRASVRRADTMTCLPPRRHRRFPQRQCGGRRKSAADVCRSGRAAAGACRAAVRAAAVAGEALGNFPEPAWIICMRYILHPTSYILQSRLASGGLGYAPDGQEQARHGPLCRRDEVNVRPALPSRFCTLTHPSPTPSKPCSVTASDTRRSWS